MAARLTLVAGTPARPRPRGDARRTGAPPAATPRAAGPSAASPRAGGPSTADPPATKLRLLTDAILADIASGRLRNGDPIASERRLAARFGVSLGTAQRALQALAHRGVLSREHGRGTFVRGLGGSVDARYLRFRDAGDRDLPVYWHMLRHGAARPTRPLARFFGDDVPLVRIDRRVDVDGRFTLLSRFFLARADFDALFRDEDPRDDSNLRELISQRLALPTLRVEQRIGFARMPVGIARALGCTPAGPCFEMELRGYTVRDRPVFLQQVHGEPFERASLVVDTSRG